MGTFGETGTGDYQGYVGLDYKYVSPFTCNGNGVFEKLSAYFSLGGGGAYLKALIYEDNAGQPSALYAVSDEVYTNAQAHWLDFPFSGTQRKACVVGKTYWLGLTGNAGSFVQWQSGTGVIHWAPSPYTAPSDPFGAHQTVNGTHLCIYATYSETGPTEFSVSISATTPTTITGPASVTFQAVPIGGTGTYTYQWYDDAGVIAGATGNPQNISFPAVSVQTLYNIHVVAYDADGSAVSNSVVVTVNPSGGNGNGGVAIKKFSTSFEQQPDLPSGTGGYHFNMINDVTGLPVDFLKVSEGGEIWVEPTQQNHGIPPLAGSKMFGARTIANTQRMEIVLMHKPSDPDPAYHSLETLGLTNQIYVSFYFFMPLGYKIGYDGNTDWEMFFQIDGSALVWEPFFDVMLYDEHHDGVSPFILAFHHKKGDNIRHQGYAREWIPPRGRWCKFEWFQTWSTTSAKIRCRIDGVTMWDLDGSFYCDDHQQVEPLITSKGDGTLQLELLKIYHAPDPYVHYRYFDNFEMWTDDPGITEIKHSLTILPSSGGTTNPAPSTTAYLEGVPVSVIAYPDTGQQFGYWLLDGANVGATNPIVVTMDADHTLQPVFGTVPTYQLAITSTTGGNTSPSGTQTYTQGTIVAVTANPIDGYSFDHWVLDGIDVGVSNPYSVAMNSSHTLQAVFTQDIIYYNLTILNPEPPLAGTPTATVQTYMAGQTAQITASSYTGYAFSHWQLDGNNAGSANPISIVMNANHTLQAVFTQIYYTLTAGPNVTLNPSGGSYPAGTVVQATANPPNGYQFTNWLLDGAFAGTSNPISITMNADHTLTAVFAQITYTLTVLDPTPTGAGTPTASTTQYNVGTPIILTAQPATNYYFDHWIIDGANIATNPITVTMDANHTVQAVFILIQYTVTIGASSGGTTSPSAGQHQYVQSTIVSLAGIPNTNYVFTSWNINGTTVTANPYELTVDRDYTVQATFTYVEPQVQFTLTLSSTTGGSTNPSGTRLYNEGTDVVVVATPATGYYFDHWLLDGVNAGANNPFTLTMNTDHTLQAVFSPIPKWTLTVTGGTPATATGYAGESVTVTAQIPTGNRFTGWTFDGGTLYTDNPLTLQITDTASHILVANFELIPTTITLTVTAGIGGTVSPSGQMTLTIGQAYQFTATENTGYDFDHWDLNGENKGSDPSIILTIIESMDKQILTALFTTEPPQKITMTLAVAGNGAIDIGTGQKTFNVGDSVTLVAIPQINETFKGWKLDGADYSTANPLTIVITLDLNGKTLTADFTEPTPFPWILIIATLPIAFIGAYSLRGKKKTRR